MRSPGHALGVVALGREWKNVYTAGISPRVMIVDPIRPPTTTLARGACASAPSPNPKASGMSPKIVVKVVIKIGRKRRGVDRWSNTWN